MNIASDINEERVSVARKNALTADRPGRIRRFFSCLGPVLITGAADDDPSGEKLTGLALRFSKIFFVAPPSCQAMRFYDAGFGRRFPVFRGRRCWPALGCAG